MPRLLMNRAGFTLSEVLVGLTLTAIIGAAVTGAFVTHSQVFDHQEKVAFARGVSRAGMNMILGELRMVEQTGGIVSLPAPTNTSITVRSPYAMGLVCGTTTVVTAAMVPTDTVMYQDAGYSGYAYRQADGTFVYNEQTGGGTLFRPAKQGGSICTSAPRPITIVSGSGNGFAVQFKNGVPTPTPALGTVVFMYQRVRYEFKPSVRVPGTIALWRFMEDGSVSAEELVAPFDTTAKFRFYVNDAPTAQTAVPAQVNTITGLELTLDGLSERPDRNGNRQRVPLTTSVFFKNRPSS